MALTDAERNKIRSCIKELQGCVQDMEAAEMSDAESGDNIFAIGIPYTVYSEIDDIITTLRGLL